MEFYERLSMRGLLWARLHDLTGNAFQDFFHDLMVMCVPGFVDVCTHGNKGDLASDGLDLHNKKLYACYAPEVPDAKVTVRKFKSDLKKAIEKRSGQFTTFVFVHNNVRGVHPEISAALAEARSSHSEILFEVMGLRHFRDMLGSAGRPGVEALLGNQLPLQHSVSVGLQEMEELLEQLAAESSSIETSVSMVPVSVNKLRYSDLTEDSQAELLDGMRNLSTIAEHYQRRNDINERNEVAAWFHREYLEAVRVGLEPEDVLLRLREFLAGSRQRKAPLYRAQTAVLAYFFETCDIFENPPSDWEPAMVGSLT